MRRDSREHYELQLLEERCRKVEIGQNIQGEWWAYVPGGYTMGQFLKEPNSGRWHFSPNNGMCLNAAEMMMFVRKINDLNDADARRGVEKLHGRR